MSARMLLIAVIWVPHLAAFQSLALVSTSMEIKKRKKNLVQNPHMQF